MTTSQNGWPASPALLTRTILVAGASFRIADDRDVETVFVYILTEYAANVEPLYASQCGGFNYRPNRNNPSQLSNHSSGTAVDVNSLKHPNGVPTRSTFTQAQVDAVHAILDSIPELSEVVHWGGDWFPPLTPDAMHFELHDHDLAKLARVAERIREAEDMCPDQEDRVVARVTEAVVKALTEGKPKNSDLTRDALLKQAQKASVEARNLLKAAGK